MPNSDDDSDYAEYGTALEPVDEDDVARKRPIPVSEQVAVDERGRRRFHGAFTGGFSAGYFNTVGSKEGWAPSTFKSSRSDRNSFKSQNVLDFMDDEDRGAFGIAPQVLRPTEDFTDRSQARGKKRPLHAQTDGPIPGVPVLDQIIQPVKETVGIKMLIKMGWRPGKGVGPKINKKAKRAKLSSNSPLLIEIEASHDVPEDDEPHISEATPGKFYGCSLPPEYVHHGSDSNDSFGDLEEAEKLLAPDDISSLLSNPKENSFGLGYKGLDRNTLTTPGTREDLFGAKLKFRVENKNMSISGEAFGVGAFEDNDTDIYSREDMSQYDFALETPEEKRRRKAQEKKDSNKRKNKENCIEGFKLSTKSSLRKKVFPPPYLPPNYQPFHSVKKSRFHATPDAAHQEPETKGLERHKLTISERQVLIADADGLERSRKDSLPKSGNFNKELAKDEPFQITVPTPAETTDTDIQHRIDRLKKFTQVLQSYSSTKSEETEKMSFKPFLKDPEKQERYEKYLTLVKAGFSECLRDLQPPEMAYWEREREKMEFDRASNLYKPMTSILSNRFVSANSHDISNSVPEKHVPDQKGPEEDPKVAAKMKLFGKLTHRIVEWHPDKLVCKRFNIPNPYPESQFVGVKGDLSVSTRIIKVSSQQTETKNATVVENVAQSAPVPKKSLFDNLDFSKPPPGLLNPEDVGPRDNSANASNIINSAIDDVDSPPPEKPSLDLFKEIFADSSDSDDDQETDVSKNQADIEPKIKPSPSKSTLYEKDKTMVNKLPSSTNNKPETLKRGVFDRIDLDVMQQSQSNNSVSKITQGQGHSKDLQHCDDEDVEEIYGPLPPKQSVSGESSRDSRPKFIPRDASLGITSHSKKDVVWVEKASVSKKHSSKKSRKKSAKKEKRKSSKSKKHKHKKKGHKHKARSKHDTSSDSDHSGSSDSDSDSSNSSVTINASLDNKALLAKLKQFSRSSK